MLLFALFAVATIAVGTVCVLFWDDILGWIKKAAQKIKEKLKKIVYGTKVLATKIAGKLRKLSKNYVRNGTEWEEYVLTKEVEAEDVPDYIRALEDGDTVDITKELELKLA